MGRRRCLWFTTTIDKKTIALFNAVILKWINLNITFISRTPRCHGSCPHEPDLMLPGLVREDTNHGI